MRVKYALDHEDLIHRNYFYIDLNILGVVEQSCRNELLLNLWNLTLYLDSVRIKLNS